MRFLTAMFLIALCAAAQTRERRFADPANWLTYDGDNTGQRYRELNQIHRGNVSRMQVAWVYQTVRLPQRSESVPLVRDGILYFTIGGEEAAALDARTGRALWTYNHQPSGPAGGPAGELGPRRGANWNRGFGLSGNRLYWATSDCRLLSIDARNGSLLWSQPVRGDLPCFGTTAAPIVIGNRVLIGERGGDTGNLRGHLDAYDAETGTRAWRLFTIPAPGEPHADSWPSTDVWKRGGAAPWTAGTWDPDLGRAFWPTGNPGPSDYDGSDRAGDNLYADSVLALNPADGKLDWHYQFTPHDLWDWDANETPVLIDAPYRGRQRKLLVQANRNAWFYVLDRTTGEFLSATPFARQTWASKFTENGRPVLNPNVTPSRKGAPVCPDVHGGTNWQPPAYSPQTGLFYVAARDSCGVYYPTGPNIDLEAGRPRQFLRAIDVGSGKVRWEVGLDDRGEISHAGAMATSGGLVFFSARDGQFMAADAATGAILWNFNVGGSIRAAPMTYSVAGRQYVAVVTKAALFAFTIRL